MGFTKFIHVFYGSQYYGHLDCNKTHELPEGSVYGPYLVLGEPYWKTKNEPGSIHQTSLPKQIQLLISLLPE